MTNFIKLLCIACMLILNITSSFAQNQTNYWYFGNKAGLNFNFSSPKVWNNSQMNTYGGGTTVSDSLGKLLFYTNGRTVWNNKHWIIGKGIQTTTASNSCRVLRLPNKPLQYYIFSLHSPREQRGYSFYWSQLDLTANQGKGKLIAKNQLIHSRRFFGGITTILHANGQDSWVVVHDTTNTFYSYLFTKKGLQPNPIKSTVGKVIPPKKSTILSFFGSLKSSPDGRRLAKLYYHEEVEIFDFNPSNGTISNARVLKGDRGTRFQYMEFSPSGQKIYASAIGDLSKYKADILYQFDLINPNRPLKTVINKPGEVPYIGGIQLAKNGKIYVNQAGYLGVIEYPERPGKLCDYNPKGISLKGRKTRSGLPTFPAHYFRPTDKIGVGTPFKRNIEFTSGQAIIQPQYYKLIDDIAEFLKKNPKTSIHITGHTDNMGQPKSNLILSKKRAQAVAKYLNQKGIKADRIETTGEGSKSPIANNQTPKGRKKNRRIEFFIK